MVCFPLQDADAAQAAGASIVGAEDLVKSIQDGNLDFDRCIATPEVMPLVSRVARVSDGESLKSLVSWGLLGYVRSFHINAFSPF